MEEDMMKPKAVSDVHFILSISNHNNNHHSETHTICLVFLAFCCLFLFVKTQKKEEEKPNFSQHTRQARKEGGKMYTGQLGRYSYNDLVKALEADIKRANALAGEIPRSKSGELVQMKLIYSPLAPLIMFMLRWMDCTCACLHSTYIKLFHILIYKVYSGRRPRISTFGRKATLRDFYAVILPSLERLHYDLENNCECEGKYAVKKKAKFCIDLEREDECGICLESCTKIVLPNCYHEMCIKCYRDWNIKSESCPFCRGSLKRVKSEDLWVLMCEDDVVDPDSVTKQDLKSFYLYVNTLPQDCPEAIFLLYYEYLF